ncbi:MAG: hypothetical protein JO022_05965 [Acidobacteriaceae bacterium]|nr:hypothetical protein [Acidobacteriaceae bacterium]
MTGIFEKLVAANIQIVPELSTGKHFVLAREAYAALVERTEDGFGNVGAGGMLTEHGLAFLVWRGEVPHFVARNFEMDATPEQVAAVRQFASDLESALTKPKI